MMVLCRAGTPVRMHHASRSVARMHCVIVRPASSKRSCYTEKTQKQRQKPRGPFWLGKCAERICQEIPRLGRSWHS